MEFSTLSLTTAVGNSRGVHGGPGTLDTVVDSVHLKHMKAPAWRVVVVVPRDVYVVVEWFTPSAWLVCRERHAPTSCLTLYTAGFSQTVKHESEVF